ncbi:hypothetical protein [Streptomyces albidoflavus]|uniref:hypothetical protein n=1 Tax=Streptomyces albidoflavus TaxID=1886 RepID=UPI001020612F|nr:hypothetical protein [Streptomyces albidoflavus]RZF02900.1 hypothetical protein C0R05_32330 [Streptomyces albidoflavus]
MIRTVITCEQHTDCRAIFLPPVDSGAVVLERAARAVGWRRLGATLHACPACTAGRGPVRDTGDCPNCGGLTITTPGDDRCRYCATPPTPPTHRHGDHHDAGA